jgi:hypothetical protein
MTKEIKPVKSAVEAEVVGAEVVEAEVVEAADTETPSAAAPRKVSAKQSVTGVTLMGRPAYEVTGGDGKPMTVKAAAGDYYDFMKERNLTRDVVDAVHSAHEAAYVEMSKTAVEQAVRNGGKCTVILPFYKRGNALTVVGKDEITTPAGEIKFKGGEAVSYPEKTVYGQVKFGLIYKLPKNEELLRFATEAEKAIKNKTRKALTL